MKKLLLSTWFVISFVLVDCDSNTSTSVEEAQPVNVTRDNYQYAEAIRNAENYVKLGGENKWGHFRDISPVGPSAPTIRMNVDTLYSVAVLDNTDGNIELIIPEGDILQTILVLDDQGYSKHYFQGPGTHKIVSDSPFVILIARLGVKDRNNENDIAKARRAQDGLIISGQGNRPFSPTQYDRASLEALTAELNQEFLAGDGVLVYGQFKDDVDEHQRLLSNAAGWGGMHDNINTYTSSVTMSGDVCRVVNFDDPEVGEFFSFTMYDDSGYLMDGNTSINSYNMERNADGTYTVSFNCGETAMNNITSTGREFNYIVRTYAASEVVKSGEWNPVSPTASLPKYKADVPDSITTPDSVQTGYLGELISVDGFPSDETVARTYDFLDTSRAVELFLNATPVTSMYAMLNGHVEIGFKPNYTVGITESLMNARSIWLTPQTTTPYVHVEVDVKNGPVVFEIGNRVILNL